MLFEIATTRGFGEDYAEAFNKYSEGNFEKQARRLFVGEADNGKAIVDWLEDGTFTFYGFTETSCAAYRGMWGGSLGIFPYLAQTSEADNEANRRGMAFYKALAAGRIDGTTAPFDICDWIGPDWEE